MSTVLPSPSRLGTSPRRRTPSSRAQSRLFRSRSAASGIQLPQIGGMSLRRTRSAVGRGPLPIGSAMNRVISARSPEIYTRVNKEMEAESPLHTSELHERREAKKKSQRAMAEWLARKKKENRDRFACIAKPPGLPEEPSRVEKEAMRKAEGEAAWILWLERKEQQEYDRKVSESTPSHGKGFKLSELRKVIQRLCKSDELFAEIDALVTHVSGPAEGPVMPDQVTLMVVGAAARRRVDLKAVELLKEAENGETRSKEDDQRIKVQRRIGEQILSVLCSGRTIFGQAMNTVKDVFKVADQNGDGEIDKDEFKFICARLDLGLATPQLQDLWASFDTDGSGNISQDEFEDLLTTVQAQRMINDPPPPLTAMEQHAANIHEAMGEEGAIEFMGTIFEAVTELRLKYALSSDEGTIGLWEFRAALRKSQSPELSAAQKSNLIRVFDQLFRKLDTKKENSVQLDDILFFIRKLLMRLSEGAKFSDGGKDNKQRLLMRIGKTIVKNIMTSSKVKGPEDVVGMAVSTFQVYDPHGRGALSRSGMMRVVKELGFSLSMVQEDMLFTSIDSDGNGTIELQEFTRFLKRTVQRMTQEDEERKEASDPRSNFRLIEAILVNVSSNKDIMLPLMLDIKCQFTGQGSARRQTSMTEASSPTTNDDGF